MGNEAVDRIHVEASVLAEDILGDLELSRIPLANVAMKCARLARLLGNDLAVTWFQAEVGGYKDGMDSTLFKVALASGRRAPESKDQERRPQVYTGSLQAIEAELEALRAEQASLRLPDLSLTESGQQGPFHTPGNALMGIVTKVLMQRQQIMARISVNTGILAGVRGAIYGWALERHHVLRFGSIPADAFQTAKRLVETHSGILTDALQKFSAAQQRAISGAPEEWAQALLSLRRMLKDLANTLYPPLDHDVDGHKMGEQFYINRLWQFVKSRVTGSKRAILSTEVQFIGQRIDALYELSCKGTHDAVSREEVDMAVVHIYLLVADLLSLLTSDERDRLTNVLPGGLTTESGDALAEPNND